MGVSGTAQVRKPADLKRVKDPLLWDMDCTNCSYSVDCPVVHEFLTLKILCFLRYCV